MMLTRGELRFIEILKRVREINQEKLREVEEQLIRGDKYEMMWRDLDKIVHGKLEFETPPPEFRGYRGGILKYYMMKIRRKYFPAPRTEYTPFMRGFKEGVELGMRFKKLNKEMDEIVRG